jgi:hypothetical protein
MTFDGARRSEMVCGTCGATIADKAIVCYRCGAATAAPAAGRPAARRAGPPWIVVVLLVIVAAVMGWLAAGAEPGSEARIALAVGAGLFAAGGVYVAWRR